MLCASHTTAQLLGGKGISYMNSCQIEIHEDASTEIFSKSAFSSRRYANQLPVSRHVKYFF